MKNMNFDKYAKNYDSGWRGTKSARFYRDLIAALEIKAGDSVLDVGCGTGTVLKLISSAVKIRGFGIDVSPKMLEIAKKKNPDFDFRLGGCDKLPYDDNSMDAMIACMAYHHFPDQKAFRKEAARVLKPGGMLYICDPIFPWIVRTILNTCFKEAGFYSTEKNCRDFIESGFVVEKVVRDLYVQVLCLKNDRLKEIANK